MTITAQQIRATRLRINQVWDNDQIMDKYLSNYMYNSTKKHGIVFHFEVVSQAGAEFILMPTTKNTLEEIYDAVEEIREERDVVRIYYGYIDPPKFAVLTGNELLTVAATLEEAIEFTETKLEMESGTLKDLVTPYQVTNNSEYYWLPCTHSLSVSYKNDEEMEDFMFSKTTPYFLMLKEEDKTPIVS